MGLNGLQWAPIGFNSMGFNSMGFNSMGFNSMGFNSVGFQWGFSGVSMGFQWGFLVFRNRQQIHQTENEDRELPATVA